MEDNGAKASDFYFKYNKRGGKLYYNKVTGRQIGKDKIPTSIINEIPELKGDPDIVELIKLVIKRDKIRLKLKELKYKGFSLLFRQII